MEKLSRSGSRGGSVGRGWRWQSGLRLRWGGLFTINEIRCKEVHKKKIYWIILIKSQHRDKRSEDISEQTASRTNLSACSTMMPSPSKCKIARADHTHCSARVRDPYRCLSAQRCISFCVFWLFLEEKVVRKGIKAVMQSFTNNTCLFYVQLKQFMCFFKEKGPKQISRGHWEKDDENAFVLSQPYFTSKRTLV